MLNWIDFFFKASILCGLLTIFLLLFKKNALRSFSDYLLTGFILFQCWTILLFILVYSGSILNYPHLYKSAAPITFLISPLGYLYVRSVLFNEVRFKKIDLLHTLPFLFFTLNYLPFFASPTESKLAILTDTLLDRNEAVTTQLGLLPETVFYIVRPIQSLVYLLFQWALLLQVNKTFKVMEVQQQVTVVTRWLKIFTLANTAVLFSLIFLILLYLSVPNIFEENLMSLVPNYLLSLLLLCDRRLSFGQSTGLEWTSFCQIQRKKITIAFRYCGASTIYPQKLRKRNCTVGSLLREFKGLPSTQPLHQRGGRSYANPQPGTFLSNQ